MSSWIYLDLAMARVVKAVVDVRDEGAAVVVLLAGVQLSSSWTCSEVQNLQVLAT